jgi:hypothetical protein
MFSAISCFREAIALDRPKNGLTLLAYFIIGIIVLVVALKVAWWLLGVALTLISIAVSVAIVVLIGYVVYVLLKSVLKNMN